MRHATIDRRQREAPRPSTKTHRRLLPLAYHPEVAGETLERLEQAARAYGLPLNDLELLGQDTEYAIGFTQAVVEGDAPTYLPLVPWDYLERRLKAQRKA